MHTAQTPLFINYQLGPNETVVSYRAVIPGHQRFTTGEGQGRDSVEEAVENATERYDCSPLGA
jgi:hypothetical protein